jgi:ribosomal protein S18 acetylase RimI-like enzyme
MSILPPIPLTPFPVELDSFVFNAICVWPFADPYVSRLLREDIPQRIQFNKSRIWVYRDPESRLVGFGTLDVCDEYHQYTAGEDHPYIPLLAVNPPFEGHGHGKSIVRHLISEAVLSCQSGISRDVLFLDVYTDNAKAIKLYKQFGFTSITDEAIPDPHEDGKTYIIMTKSVSTPQIGAPS